MRLKSIQILTEGMDHIRTDTRQSGGYVSRNGSRAKDLEGKEGGGGQGEM